ncbi:secretion system protein TadC [Knoellia sinensis KCTC 19936]|uniref:Secretion system protein TadC n=1 Tax=Knoellia sinensis KCTC 19936 TaxID=1385520 RepID=A0A0A0J6D4_9MICO|nr:type II secretion system F family protein [Knoellia sinensis]KGN32344.1 secretion system protein TadC [Knoellia sinensis KCTC 19936]
MLFVLGFGIILAAIGVLAVSLSTGGPTGVARSLVLIEHSLDRREVAKAELSGRDRILIPLLDATRGLATRLSPAGTTDRIARRLDRIGNPPAWPVERIMGAKGAALLVGALLGLVYGGGLTIKSLFLSAVLGAGLFFLPDVLLYNVALRRKDAVQRSLADALDMLTVCVEAGQGFDAALLQVARSVEGPIAGEFARVISEIQLGKSRADAFSALADRTSVAELKNFVSALVQADRLGVPIAGVLREQAKTMRLVRRQLAEEKAQKVPVKILFPLMLCILPVLFIVVMGPGVIQMMEAFSGRL